MEKVVEAIEVEEAPGGLLLTSLTVFQATRLRHLMGTGTHTCSQFIELFFKAANSVALYKHRAAIERGLEDVFDMYDLDHDRRICFDDLEPMPGVLMASDGADELHPNIVVYNEVPAQLLINVPGQSGESIVPSSGHRGRKSHQAVQSPISQLFGTDARTRARTSNPTAVATLFLERYAKELDFTDCSMVMYHPAVQKHTMAHGHNLVIFDIDRTMTAIDVVAILYGFHTAPILTAVHVPHLKRFFTASADRTVAAWADGDRYQLLETIRSDVPLTHMLYEPLTRRLIAGGTDGNLYVFPATPVLQHAERVVQAHTEWVTGLVAVPEMDCLATCSGDGSLKLWDRNSLALKVTKYVPDRKRLSKLVYSKSQRTLYTCVGLGRRVIAWSTFLQQPVEALAGHEKPIVSVHAFGATPEIITVDQGGKVNVWDLSKGFNIAQSAGAADHICPIGSVESMAYNAHKSCVVTLGENLSVLYPHRGGVHNALIDVAPSHIVVDNISRRIFVAAGAQLFMFDFLSGKLINTFTMGTQEISAMAMGISTNTFLIGTAEGTALVLDIVKWHSVQQLNIQEPVRLVQDLGTLGRLAFRSPDYARALAVASNGDVWHFPYGASMPDFVIKTAAVFRTSVVQGPEFVSFSQALCFAYFAYREEMEIWDVAGSTRKPSRPLHGLSGLITSLLCVDDLNTVFVGTSAGQVLGYHNATTVPIVAVDVKPSGFEAFGVAHMCFEATTWSLTISCREGMRSIFVQPLVSLLAGHVQALRAQFFSCKVTLKQRYVVDMGTQTASPSPMFICYKKAAKQEGAGPPPGGTSLRTLLVCIPPSPTTQSEHELLVRLQRLKDWSKGAFGSRAFDASRYVASVSHVGTPASTPERILAHPSTVYAVCSLAPQTGPFLTSLERFLRMGEIPVHRRTTEQLQRALAELSWLVGCTAKALLHLSDAGLVPLLDVDDMHLCHDTYRLYPAQGVWELPGCERGPLEAEPSDLLERRTASRPHFRRRSTRYDAEPAPDMTAKERKRQLEETLPPWLRPPEGFDGTPTVELCMWRLGLFIYHTATALPLIPENTPQTSVDVTFQGLQGNDPEAVATKVVPDLEQALEDSMFNAPSIRRLIRRLLCHKYRRWGPREVLDFLRPEPPRHMKCVPLPTHYSNPQALTLAADVAQQRQLLSPVATPVLSDSHITAAGVADQPFLFCMALFTGGTAYIAVTRPDNTIVGVVPQSNEIRVPWAVAEEEIGTATKGDTFHTPRRKKDKRTLKHQEDSPSAADKPIDKPPGKHVEKLEKVVVSESPAVELPQLVEADDDAAAKQPEKKKARVSLTFETVTSPTKEDALKRRKSSQPFASGDDITSPADVKVEPLQAEAQPEPEPLTLQDELGEYDIDLDSNYDEEGLDDTDLHPPAPKPVKPATHDIMARYCPFYMTTRGAEHEEPDPFYMHGWYRSNPGLRPKGQSRRQKRLEETARRTDRDFKVFTAEMLLVASKAAAEVEAEEPSSNRSPRREASGKMSPMSSPRRSMSPRDQRLARNAEKLDDDITQLRLNRLLPPRDGPREDPALYARGPPRGGQLPPPLTDGSSPSEPRGAYLAVSTRAATPDVRQRSRAQTPGGGPSATPEPRWKRAETPTGNVFDRLTVMRAKPPAETAASPLLMAPDPHRHHSPTRKLPTVRAQSRGGQRPGTRSGQHSTKLGTVLPRAGGRAGLTQTQ